MSATKKTSKKSAPLPTGTLLANRYRLLSVLGRGTVGAAYKALDEYTQSVVCIKVLAALGMHEQKLEERLRRELMVSRKVSHKHLCRVFDLQREGELLFLVMEYIEGETLLSRMKSERAISQKEATRVIYEAASALACAHQKGIVHRDIKPDNIMLAKDGRTVVLDFGIALDAELQRLTQAGVVLGSTRYIAPEVWLGETPSGKSDVFALGVLLFALLTKRHPYSGEELFRVLSSGQTCSAPSGRLYAKMSEALDEVVQKAIAVSTDDRYQSASEFVAALGALSGEPQKRKSKVLRPTQACADETSPKRKNRESMSQIEAAVLRSVFEAATSALDLSNVALPKMRQAEPSQAQTQEHTYIVSRGARPQKARSKGARSVALAALCSFAFLSAPAKNAEVAQAPIVVQEAAAPVVEAVQSVAPALEPTLAEVAQSVAPALEPTLVEVVQVAAEEAPVDPLSHLKELTPAPKFVSAFAKKKMKRQNRTRKMRTRVKSATPNEVQSEDWRVLLTRFNQRYDRMSAEQQKRADPVMKLLHSRISQNQHKRVLRLLKHALSVFKV